MIVYSIGTILSVIFAYISLIIKRKNNDIYILQIRKQYGYTLYIIFAICSFLPLFIISAIRYNVGTDYFYTYVPQFEAIIQGKNATYELGFTLINKFILLFSNDYAGVFIITSFIFCFFIYKSIYEQSEDICYSIILLMVTTSYFISLNIVRQCIGIAIFLYAIKYIKQNNFIRYLICIFIAITIHTSSIIYIPIYFLCKNKINLKVQILLLIIVAIFKGFVSDIFIYIVELTKYGTYFNSQYNTGQFAIFSFIINLAILIFCYLFYSVAKEDKEYRIFVNIQFICVFLILFSSVIPLISRIIVDFTFCQIIFLPKIIKYIKNKYIQIITKFLILILYLIYMINTIIILGYHQVLPYQTIFSR